MLNKNLLLLMWEQSYALAQHLTKMEGNPYPSNEVKGFVKELSDVNNKFLEIFSDDESLQLADISLKQLNEC